MQYDRIALSIRKFFNKVGNASGKFFLTHRDRRGFDRRDQSTREKHRRLIKLLLNILFFKHISDATVLIANCVRHNTGQNCSQPGHQFGIAAASEIVSRLMSLKHQLLDNVRRIQPGAQVCW